MLNPNPAEQEEANCVLKPNQAKRVYEPTRTKEPKGKLGKNLYRL